MPVRIKGWVRLLIDSKNPATKAKGLQIKARLTEDHERDMRLWRRAPGYRNSG